LLVIQYIFRLGRCWKTTKMVW